MISKRILVKVPGGLGNQLFSYFAALYVHQRLGIPLEINLASVDSKHTSGLFDLTSFRIHSDNISRRRNLDVLIHEAKWFPQILILKIIRKFKIWFPKYLVLDSTQMNFGDVESIIDGLVVSKRRRNIEMRGYFQEAEYFEKISDDLKSLELMNPSPWFHSKSIELSQSDWIGLHIRLGDFTEISQIYGILGPNYYLEAVRMLSAKTGINKIAVFSNDVRLAKEIFIPVLEQDFYVEIISNEGEQVLDPAEELKLLASCKAIIVANSTFSIWAGLISERNTSVVYPHPFYRNSNDLNFVFPSNWYEVASSWWDISQSKEMIEN
jgi:hypothetical protein